MLTIDCVAQPAQRTTLDALEGILSKGPFDSMYVAAAYITTGGAFDLLETMRSNLGGHHDSMEKRWVTSFDYRRTEPVALRTLMALAGSQVRVFDASFCLSTGGMPKVPFHPKAFLFRKGKYEVALAGSGNLSRSGLSRGYEAGLVLGTDASSTSLGSDAVASMSRMRSWYDDIWKRSTPLTPGILKQYSSLYESAENLKHPTATDDDVASADTSTQAISHKDLQKLRVCRHLWIEAGNITKNRGPRLPGNQLMMKRMSRVFFGFASRDLPENSPVGNVQLSFNGGPMVEYSLTYSDNKMDKLVLPIPGTDGPPSYDNLVLLFETVAARQFVLKICSPKDLISVRKRSQAVGGAFKMSSGREWGVF